ncbi:MAG: hypothetical protein EOO24_12805, partial [Comamonadaceae bacterium]
LYQRFLLQGQRAKLGLDPVAGGDDADVELLNDWLGLLREQAVDFTLAWRRLADAADGDDAALQALFSQPQALQPWLARWRARCERDVAVTPQDRAARMRLASPWIIPRNHRVEEALEAASARDDMGPFDRLLAALRNPYEETAENAAYAQPAPAAVTAGYQTFCGT